MLPSILASQLEKGIGDYIDTTFPMNNAPFRGSVQEMLTQKDAVYHAPYVAVRLPFRVAPEMPTCFQAIHPEYLPYVHQQKAFERLTGDDGRSTLVATGTGSGKTECFLYPILEYCYQHRKEKGIKALIIYPMNALATDQAKRIAELIYNSPELRGNVTAGMYVGGLERTPARTMTAHGVITDHETMLNTPPSILLTNYKMLDYLLVRPKDALLWQNNDAETLKYIAVDELHTFDGAQGTDLACLLRRLKRRLGIYDGFLCCIGTSATMGSKENHGAILRYAQEIFGEPFEKDAIITEDRLSAPEFFAGAETLFFALPTPEQTAQLALLAEEDDPSAYLQCAVKAWFPEFALDVLSDAGRLELGRELLHHAFFQAVLTLTKGSYYQVSRIAEALAPQYPQLARLSDAETAINSLFALVSHARTGKPKKLRPFLNVQVQLWMRELRRVVAKVDAEHVTYKIAHDLNRQQSRQYLPVINCRDCGITGWATILNERQNAALPKLEAFYNRYFQSDEKITMLFPYPHENCPAGMLPARICPDCLHVKTGADSAEECASCGVRMVDVVLPNPVRTAKVSGRKQYVCPCCGSRSGLSLMGIRSATEISASISQMFASRFNDDKKALAFSDNVQDAAHRAGFFNSRTWRFGLRTAIQRYCTASGSGQSLAAFQAGFIRYWHQQLTDEQFVSFFIAPNLIWKRAYEEMIQKRKLAKTQEAQALIRDIEQRLQYEILLEYGLASKIGRTLERSACSVLSFAPEDIAQIASMVQLRTVNELGVLPRESNVAFQRMVIGWLDRMRGSGAFEDAAFNEYTANDGKGYLLSNNRNRWLPGQQSGRNIPRFLAEFCGKGRPTPDFDLPSSRRYTDWVASCCSDMMLDALNFQAISKLILEEAVKAGVVVELPSSANYKVYGLNKERVFLTTDVVQLRCEACGALRTVSAEDAPLWEGAPCARSVCGGTLAVYTPTGVDYYNRLYHSGDLARINAREHTGLLERPEREQLERDFKRGKDTQALWDPNVLSCTPTLEMGIDIGDLSTVILCSMPPAQSQFLQRAGRAGRKDGNALTLAIANARPHDLYFYADPLEMISGAVTPPRIFLRASAVLERQFVAFCMDSWVRKGMPEGAIPEKVGVILKQLDARPADLFPFNFLQYVQSTLSRQINSFVQMFAAYLDETAKEELQAFARGTDTAEHSMQFMILDAFQSLKKQLNSLYHRVDALSAMIQELENKPKDSSYDEEINAIGAERKALLEVMQEINKKNVFNFLSDEGLLPNYAFPEAGIILRAVLYRKSDEKLPSARKKYDKMVYEYNRSASSALSEFAPSNSFYVDGHKLTIDQVDLTTAQATRWRLCPNCSHAQIEEAGRDTAACPQCGSPGWADSGQVRTMLKVQMVYSNMDYTKTLISDESDERSNVFYCKKMLVDVDEMQDITCAYSMDIKEFPFGYEFVRKATLREINFGESDITGEKLSVSGEEDVRKGFRICKYCGKIQTEHDKDSNHSRSCKVRRNPVLAAAGSYEECLFLYREFTTEALRLLIPATTIDLSSVRMESFVAAFMLGMKEYFGNVDHLRATVSEVPVPDADYRKQYLVIYDSIPGGTGYLKQLMHEKDALIQVFEKALHVMETCSCKDDPQKDGCYHCLYAYRQSQQMGSISRSTAIRLLKSILTGRDHVRKIDKISSISVNPLFDSELELRFLEAIRLRAGSANFRDTIRNGKHCYYVTLNGLSWEIEPQVQLGPEKGVAVPCQPDFILWPTAAPAHKPVAVFTDGFLYHKDIVPDDTLKREAIRRSGQFRVWSLSFKDVQQIFIPQGDYFTSTLEPEKMPLGKVMYHNEIKKLSAESLDPSRLSAFDLLIAYLKLPDAEHLFTSQAHAYALSLLNPALIQNRSAFDRWHPVMQAVNDQLHFTTSSFSFGTTAYGTWVPRSVNTHLSVYAGIPASVMKTDGAVSVCAVLQDAKESRTDKYELEWNGFWQFSNLMQFAASFAAVSSTGIQHMDYAALPVPGDPTVPVPDAAVPHDSAWEAVLQLLFEEEAKTFAAFAQKHNIPAPAEDDIGFEVVGKAGDVIGTIELAWPDKKIGFMTTEQAMDRETIQQLGWTLFTVSDLESADFSILGEGLES